MPHPSTLLPSGTMSRDATKTVFKSSTRLECMMQDFPKALPQGAKVGFTTVNQVGAAPGGAPETTASYGNLSRKVCMMCYMSHCCLMWCHSMSESPQVTASWLHTVMLAVYTC